MPPAAAGVVEDLERGHPTEQVGYPAAKHDLVVNLQGGALWEFCGRRHRRFL